MKGIEIFCASQASTAICHSMYEASSSSSPSSNTVQLGGRAIDRHNPIIRDPRRTPSRDLNTPQSPSLSSSSSSPYHQPQKSKKSSGSKPSKKGHDQKKKKSGAGRLSEHIANSYCSKPIESVLRKSWVKPPSGLITPPGSSRYLLTDTSISDGPSDYDPVSGLTPFDVDNNKKEAQDVHHQDQTNHASKPSGSSPSIPASSNQVVVLKAYLHCKGCEGKLRKHLSRMEGVTSFIIDSEAKRVTIVGDVTPLSVLASVSKFKHLKFWPLSATPEAKK